MAVKIDTLCGLGRPDFALLEQLAQLFESLSSFFRIEAVQHALKIFCHVQTPCFTGVADDTVGIGLPKYTSDCTVFRPGRRHYKGSRTQNQCWIPFDSHRVILLEYGLEWIFRQETGLAVRLEGKNISCMVAGVRRICYTD